MKANRIVVWTTPYCKLPFRGSEIPFGLLDPFLN